MGIELKKSAEARIFMEGIEVCREYFKTGKITFGTSFLLQGQKGETDWGHKHSEEIFFVVRGHVLLEGKAGDYCEMFAGDSALILPETPHTLTNIGNEPALISWSMAPGEGE